MTLAEIEKIAWAESGPGWTAARLADLRSEVADGCAGLVAQDIAEDIMFAVGPDDWDGDDVWALIDEIMGTRS